MGRKSRSDKGTHRSRRRPRYMRDSGRRYRRHHNDRHFPLAFAPSIMVPAGMILAGGDGQTGMLAAFKTGDMNTIVHEAQNIIPYETIGYRWDGSWDFSIIARNIGLVLGGYVAHTVAQRLGINRQFKKIPIVGKYLMV